MSVQQRPWPEVPEQTVAVAQAAFPKGTPAMRVRDELPGLFVDDQFASAFGVRGRPGIWPGQLALVTVTGVRREPDRSAGRGCRAGPDRLEVCPGSGADRSGFDHTVLTGFRQRLIDHGLGAQVGGPAAVPAR